MLHIVIMVLPTAAVGDMCLSQNVGYPQILVDHGMVRWFPQNLLSRIGADDGLPKFREALKADLLGIGPKWLNLVDKLQEDLPIFWFIFWLNKYYYCNL